MAAAGTAALRAEVAKWKARALLAEHRHEVAERLARRLATESVSVGKARWGRAKGTTAARKARASAAAARDDTIHDDVRRMRRRGMSVSAIAKRLGIGRPRAARLADE
ncbi:hypothetical protein [Anaeromyxobacter sp. SG64]|uniref:hypothetical protein n=1 Tax=Anaeromyxobacter sp. SG64 TaxID=2925409 RepID=UPI001F580463|nr:hypothetical protein [Anaeromyxobacter sp. SG64]